MRTRGRGGRLLSRRIQDDSFLNLLMENVNNHSTTDSDSHNEIDEEQEFPGEENVQQDCTLPVLDQQEPENSGFKDEVERDEDGREILIILGKCFISTAAPRSMLSDLRGWFNGIWPTFNKIPNDVKLNLFNKFKAKFTWRAPFTEQHVFKIWKGYFSRTMTLEMRRIRRSTKSRSGTPPTWMKKEIFDGLWDIWDARKFKDRQTSNRQNRLSDRDGLGVVKSSGGTISIPHHARRMARKNGGRPVPHEQVFIRTHKTNKGQGTFVDKKSEKIYGTYIEKLKEKQSQSNESMILPSIQGSCTYDHDLWVEASGGPKNGRCYGFGNSYNDDMIFSATSSSINSCQVEIEQRGGRLQELERQQKEMSTNFDQKIDNAVKNAVSAALAMHGIYSSQHFSPGSYSSSGQFSIPTAPSYFPAQVASGGYFPAPGYFRVSSQYPHVHYQASNQDHSPAQHQSSENNQHSPDQLVTRL